MIHSFLNRHGASFHRYCPPLSCSCCVLSAFVLNRHGASFHRLLVLFDFGHAVLRLDAGHVLPDYVMKPLLSAASCHNRRTRKTKGSALVLVETSYPIDGWSKAQVSQASLGAAAAANGLGCL